MQLVTTKPQDEASLIIVLKFLTIKHKKQFIF